MRKILIVFGVSGALAVAGYLFLRFSLNTNSTGTAKAATIKVDSLSSESVLDLRPKLVQKLQQLVKEGSGGLYNLSIGNIEPDILESKLDLSNVTLIPDSSALEELKENKLSKDIYKIRIDSIHIDGIGLNDLLAKNSIDLKYIYIYKPDIEVYHKASNKDQQQDKTTFYQHIVKQIKHLGVDRIVVRDGSVVDHNLSKNETSRLSNISVQMADLLVDSLTQFDKSRYLFSKEVNLTLKNYKTTTSDKLYDFKINTISIAASRHQLKALGVELLPRYNRQEFEKRLTTLKEEYHLTVRNIQLDKIDWWQLANEESLIADNVKLSNAKLDIYLDRALPLKDSGINNFPHQLLMKMKFPIQLKRLSINDMDVSYEEFNPNSGRSGKVYFNNINSQITNITNIPQQIKHNGHTLIKGSCLLMKQVPLRATMNLDLSHYKTGNFTADLEGDGFDASTYNNVIEPLGLLMIKSGNLQSLKAHIEGNNFIGKGKVTCQYNNLHVTPLKLDNNQPGVYKKKSIYSLIANTFVIHDSNPSKGVLRSPDCSYKSNPQKTFFNLIWKTLLVGILKTIGAPEKLAN
jgi:hypothetical protein